MGKTRQIIKKIYYRCKYCRKQVKLASTSNIGGFHTFFGGRNVISEGTSFTGEIGYGSYIGSNCDIQAKIGKYCAIAKNVMTVIGNHPTKNYVSIHPAFFSTRGQAGFTYIKGNCFEEISFADKGYSVIIGNDVWIGASAIILNGVTIGDGAVIAAGAVVVQDVAPYSIVGGVPARLIRHRFSDEEIKFLLELKWWDKPEIWLRKYAKCFQDISDLMKIASEENGKSNE